MNESATLPVFEDRRILEAFRRAQAMQPATDADPAATRERIKRLLRERDAVLVAHYYTSAEIQELAEETGGYISDSLDMARFGHEHAASTLIVAGVRFMGETAKILNPEKRVLMPEIEANCSLDIGCPADEFRRFIADHPGRTVVVYANTSAEVKALADWMVTSSIALKIVNHLKDRGERILWAPDRHLGDYIQRETGADMVMWPGACVVHEEFKLRELLQMKALNEGAAILVHPESPAEVVRHADVVGSTTALINAARDLPNRTLIVATDKGIFYKMRQAAPGKTILEAPTAGRGATCKSCAHCPWMAMNSLANVARCLETGRGEIHVPEAIRVRALKPVQRMLDFAKHEKQGVLGQGDA